jgi:hypothetical protein
MQPSSPQSQSRFPSLVRFRAPAGFMEAIDTAARQHHQTASDFMRQLLVREMRRAGVTLRDGKVGLSAQPEARAQ